MSAWEQRGKYSAAADGNMSMVPTTGAEPISIYAITSTGTATVSYAYPG